MTRKASPHKHGLASVHILRKKSKLRCRRNKVTATNARLARHASLEQFYQNAIANLA